MEEAFPVSPPVVRCLTPIYHPNIDPTDALEDSTNICLDMFDDDNWNDVYGLDGTLQGILFLFYHPNIDDPLSPYFEPSLSEDEFKDNVMRSLRGENVEGVQYTCNIHSGAEDIAKNDEMKVELIMEVLSSKDDSIVKTANESVTQEGKDTATEVKENMTEKKMEVDENVTSDNINTNEDQSTVAHEVSNLMNIDSIIAQSENPTLPGYTMKSNSVCCPLIYQHSQSNYYLPLQTFGGLSSETDFLLFVFSHILSKLFTTFFPSCS